MLEEIELTNWKTHGHTMLYFSKGTNILVGQMGAGKSSVLDAISFALFGTFPAVKGKRINTEDLIRNRPEQEESAKVKLKFSVGTDSYAVEREIHAKGTAKARLERNGEYVQSQPQRVTEEIERALKIDYDLFSRVIYSEQNNLDYFLELRSSERKRQIDNLLGLDRFSTAQDNATSLANRIKFMADEEEKSIKALDLPTIKSQLSELEKRASASASETEKISAAISLLKEAKSKADVDYAKTRGQYSRKIALINEATSASSKLAAMQDEIKAIESMGIANTEGIIGQLREAEATYSTIKANDEKALGRLQALRTSIGGKRNELLNAEKAEAEIAKLKEGIKGMDEKKVREEIEKNSAMLKLLEQEAAAFSHARKENERWIAELKEHDSQNCPLCDRPLDDGMKQQLISTKQGQINEIHAKESAYAKRIRELSDAIEALRESDLMLKKNSSLIAANMPVAERKLLLKEEIISIEFEITKLEKERNKTKAEIEKAASSVSALRISKDSAERRDKHLRSAEELESKIAAINAELSEIKVSEAELDEMQKGIVAINSDLSTKTAQLESNRRMHDEISKQISDKKKEIKVLEEMQSSVARKRKAAEDVAKVKAALEETQTALRTRLISSINAIMQAIWPDIYPYGDYGDIALSATDGDYSMQVRTSRNGGMWEPVESIASGGERSSACMALRIAFAHVLAPNLKWLILDEPTHNIDQQGITKMLRLFNEVLPEMMEQIFVITHDEQLKQISNGKVYSLTRNKDEGKETEAIEI